MNIKTIFRGYGPSTNFKTVERIEDWPYRLFQGDFVEIEGAQYKVLFVFLRKNEVIVEIRPSEMNPENCFQMDSWYRIE